MKTVFSVIVLFSSYFVFAQDINDYYELGQYAKAIEHFNQLENPTKEDQLILAKAYTAKGMTSQCLKAYEKALSDTKPDEFLKSKFQYAKILQTQNKLKKADSIYTSLIAIMPDHAEVYYQKGKIGEKLEESAYHQMYLTALLYDPTHIKAAHEASRYFMRIDNLKMAKKICLETLKKVPHTPRLINLLAQIHYREDDYKTSLAYIQELETLKANLPKFIYEIKGNNFLKLNMLNPALKAYEKAYKKDKTDYSICLKIAEIGLFLDRMDVAQQYLTIYNILKDNSMWEYNFLKGKVFLKQKHYRMAFAHFDKTLKENVSHEGARYYRAVAIDNSSDDKSAVLDYYTNYIEFFEDKEDARYVKLAINREVEIRRELFMKK